jgi:hypothetical protein
VPIKRTSPRKYGPTSSNPSPLTNPSPQETSSSWVTPFSEKYLNIGGGTNGISEFVGGLASAARQTGGGKETQSKHKRKQSGLPSLEGTLALGYTYIDIHDEENDGMCLQGGQKG